MRLTRKYKPRRGLRGRFWKLLTRIAPELGKRYLAHIMRAEIRAVAAPPGVRPCEPLTFMGFFRTHLGTAQGSRILASGLAAAGIDVKVFDCSDLVPHQKTESVAAEAEIPANGTLVFCVNPPELYKLFRQFGPEICRGKRLIGYWWWELDRLPPAWRRWAGIMHEIWVSSRFLHDTFRRELPGKTIRLLPLPVERPTPSSLSLADFGVPSGRFTVLSAFDLQSGWARKNPEGAVEAFRRAFTDPDQAQLVLKVTGAAGAPKHAAHLRSIISAMPNVHLIDRFLPAADLSALISGCDALLSLHRSEGLGLFVAEAMWLGVPVIATGWSGVMDLIDDNHAMLVKFKKIAVKAGDYFWVPRGATWAEPDIDHAVACLRRLAGNPDLCAELGRRGAEKAERLFNLTAFCRDARTMTGLETRAD